MTEEEIVLFEIRRVVASLPEDKRRNVEDAAVDIRAVIEKYPEGEGLVAVALIGAEEAAKG